MSAVDNHNLKKQLTDWTDIDGAAYALAQSIGLITEHTSFQAAKHVFWSNNAVGNSLDRMLDALVDAQVLEKGMNPISSTGGIQTSKAHGKSERHPRALRIAHGLMTLPSAGCSECRDAASAEPQDYASPPIGFFLTDFLDIRKEMREHPKKILLQAYVLEQLARYL